MSARGFQRGNRPGSLPFQVGGGGGSAHVALGVLLGEDDHMCPLERRAGHWDKGNICSGIFLAHDPGRLSRRCTQWEIKGLDTFGFSRIGVKEEPNPVPLLWASLAWCVAGEDVVVRHQEWDLWFAGGVGRSEKEPRSERHLLRAVKKDDRCLTSTTVRRLSSGPLRVRRMRVLRA